MKNKSALYIQYAGACFVGYLAGGATDTFLQALGWIVAWVVVCTAIRIMGDA